MPMIHPRGLLSAGLFSLCASASLFVLAAGDKDENASALNRPSAEIPAYVADTGDDVDESQFSTDTAPPPIDPDYRQPAAEAAPP